MAPRPRIYMRARGVRPPCIPMSLSCVAGVANLHYAALADRRAADQAVVPVPGLMRRRARVHRLPLLAAVVILLLAATTNAIRPSPDDGVKPVQHALQGAAGSESDESVAKKKGFLQEEVYATGSSLPDCSHACGPCKPCNRVMVSFKCSIAEPCPMVYRCMCKGKCYPVPSS